MTLNNLSAEDVYQKAVDSRQRLPELESIILQSSHYSYLYARDIIQQRWPEAESTILKSDWMLCYAKYVIKGAWSEAEPFIAQHAEYSLYYSQDILKERFHEGEEAVAKSILVNYYGQYWFQEPVVKKHEVDELRWLRSGAKGYYAPKSLFKRPFSFLDNLMESGE